jgi:hypothetical protein
MKVNEYLNQFVAMISNIRILCCKQSKCGACFSIIDFTVTYKRLQYGKSVKGGKGIDKAFDKSVWQIGFNWNHTSRHFIHIQPAGFLGFPEAYDSKLPHFVSDLDGQGELFLGSSLGWHRWHGLSFGYAATASARCLEALWRLTGARQASRKTRWVDGCIVVVLRVDF